MVSSRALGPLITPLVTFDGEKTRIHDDALGLTSSQDTYTSYVAIPKLGNQLDRHGSDYSKLSLIAGRELEALVTQFDYNSQGDLLGANVSVREILTQMNIYHEEAKDIFRTHPPVESLIGTLTGLYGVNFEKPNTKYPEQYNTPAIVSVSVQLLNSLLGLAYERITSEPAKGLKFSAILRGNQSGREAQKLLLERLNKEQMFFPPDEVIRAYKQYPRYFSYGTEPHPNTEFQKAKFVISELERLLYETWKIRPQYLIQEKLGGYSVSVLIEHQSQIYESDEYEGLDLHLLQYYAAKDMMEFVEGNSYLFEESASVTNNQTSSNLLSY